MSENGCRDCGSLNIDYRPAPWWDELVEAAEWPPDEQRDAKLLAWATQYSEDVLEAATNAYIARNHRLAKNKYDDPRRGWMTYVRNEFKWKPKESNNYRQKQTNRY